MVDRHGMCYWEFKPTKFDEKNGIKEEVETQEEIETNAEKEGDNDHENADKIQDNENEAQTDNLDISTLSIQEKRKGDSSDDDAFVDNFAKSKPKRYRKN